MCWEAKQRPPRPLFISNLFRIYIIKSPNMFGLPARPGPGISRQHGCLEWTNVADAVIRDYDCFNQKNKLNTCCWEHMFSMWSVCSCPIQAFQMISPSQARRPARPTQPGDLAPTWWETLQFSRTAQTQFRGALRTKNWNPKSQGQSHYQCCTL